MFETRLERKYILSFGQYELLKHRLRGMATPDPNAHEGGYKCLSKYYDTANNDFLFEHINGERRHCKVRIRSYDEDNSFLEIKMKNLERSYKWRKRLNNDLDNDFIKLGQSLETDEVFRVVRCGDLAYKSMVTYYREPFNLVLNQHPLRLCMDRDLFIKPAWAKRSKRFLGPENVILELKSYNEAAIQMFLKHISFLKVEETAFSKYCEGMKAIL